MRRAGGYTIITQPGKGNIEKDTMTCAHCQHVSFLKPYSEPEHRCKQCFGYVCKGPHCPDECRPLEEQLRMMESPTYRPRKIFKIG